MLPPHFRDLRSLAYCDHFVCVVAVTDDGVFDCGRFGSCLKLLGFLSQFAFRPRDLESLDQGGGVELDLLCEDSQAVRDCLNATMLRLDVAEQGIRGAIVADWAAYPIGKRSGLDAFLDALFDMIGCYLLLIADESLELLQGLFRDAKIANHRSWVRGHGWYRCCCVRCCFSYV